MVSGRNVRAGVPRGRLYGVCDRRRRVWRHLAWSVGLAVAACSGEAGRQTPNDRAPDASPAAAAAGAVDPALASWPSALGGLLVVGTPGGSVRSGVLLLPDAPNEAEAFAAVRGSRVELFGATGRVGEATIVAVERADTTECVAWPMARLQLPTNAAVGPWSLAARTGIAVPMASLDVTAMGGRDSARLVVELARLASGLPGDSNPSFRGLPMLVRTAVRTAVRVSGVPTREVVVAEIVRRVGQEATPLEERIALVAERDSGTATPWRAGWFVRTDGVEESIESSDFAGALQLGADPPIVVLQRESAKGARFELLVRTAQGWERRWTSAWSGC